MKGSLAPALLALALPGAVAQFNANGEHTSLQTAVGVWCDDSANAYANAIASHGDISTWNTAGVDDMSGLFSSTHCSNAAFNSDISDWDVSSVTTFEGMFEGATSFNQDLSGWDTSSATNMDSMFKDAAAFTGTEGSGIGSWDVSIVEDFDEAFSGATVFNADVSSWDLSGCKKMNSMFLDAAAFNADVSSWDVSIVTDMTSMFSGATSFNADLNSWDIQQVTALDSMFDGATAFTQELCGHWGDSTATGGPLAATPTLFDNGSGGSICAPSPVPTYAPSEVPTYKPTGTPTLPPTPAPSFKPSPEPSEPPTPSPTPGPSFTPTYAPSEVPTYKPTGTPTLPPTPAPSRTPTPAPSPSPTDTPMPTSTPTAEDTSRIEVSLSLSSTDNSACDASDNSTFIKAMTAQAMSTDENTISKNDIVSYDVSGCNSRRRRRKLMSTVAVITIGFAISPGSSNYETTQAMYDSTTTTLRAAIATLTSRIAHVYGGVSIETIKVAITRRAIETAAPVVEEEPVVEMPYYAGSDCPNGCSGHGQCSTNGCVCYRNWGNGDEDGGACDTRICPEEIAWVDTPNGENSAHRLAECAGRGICDRETGDCSCFPGYEGKGCKRTSCPNGCSGHGTCEFLAEMRNDLGDEFKWTGGKPTRDQYDFEFPLLWDAHKTRGCVCDPKYTGVDCSIRMCPRGDFSYFHALDKTPETQMIVIKNLYSPGTDVSKNGIDYKNSDITNGTDSNGEFALTFRSTLNEEFTTYALNAYNITAADVEDALNSLPNKVIEEAQVAIYRDLDDYNSTTYGLNPDGSGAKWLGRNNGFTRGAFPFTAESNYTWYETDLVILVTYRGSMTTGDQYALECRTAYCGAGCQPKLEHPLDKKEHSECNVVNNVVEAIGVNWECSGRGLCSSTGVCECFEGYTDEYCSTKTAIV